jgi:polyhydroxybutyrate depolymerase
MKTRILVFLLVSQLVCAAACGQRHRHAAAGDSVDPPSQMTLQHDGRTRTFLVQTVENARRDRLPTVILLHGGTQNAEKAWRQTSFPELARRHRFVLIAPDGIDGNWNDGRDKYQSGADSAQVKSVDDVGFISALIEKADTEFGADPARVYVTGSSNGGLMSWRLLCERPELFAAGAPTIATLTLNPNERCPGGKGIPVIATFGTEDPLMPYDGSPVIQRGSERMEARSSAPESTRWWAVRNGCTAETDVTKLADNDPKDDSTLARYEYRNCPRGAAVVRIDAVGGGHFLPGSKVRDGFVLKRILGSANRDADGAMLIWDFVSQFGK